MMKGLLLALCLVASPLSAQLRTSLTLCPKVSVTVGDKFVTKKSPTGTLCIVRDTTKPKPDTVYLPTPIKPDTVIPPPPVVVPPAPGSNEPSGMTKLGENAFSCTTHNCLPGWGFYESPIALVSDSTAPKSKPSIAVQTFLTSLPGGSSPSTVDFNMYAQKQTLYTSMYVKVSVNWFGNSSNVNKVIHYFTNGIGASPTFNGTGNKVIFMLRGAGMAPLVAGLGFQGLSLPYTWYSGTTKIVGGEVNLYGDPSACTVTRGAWHRYEVLLVGNTPGVANGSATLWMDGKRCTGADNVGYTSADRNPTWSSITWSPTYGGGAPGPPYTMTMAMDHLYISGK